jgi:hypothetical protein
MSALLSSMRSPSSISAWLVDRLVVDWTHRP